MARYVTNVIETGTLDAWSYEACEVVELDWDRYSKGWHRSHGPARSVESRTVTLTRPWGRGQRRIVAEVAGWRGDWLAAAVDAAGLAPKRHKALKKIRLTDAHDAHKTRVLGGVTFHARTLLGAVVDHVAVSDGVTFHADTERAAVRGLREKLRARALRAEGRMIDRTLINRLGFCDAGVEDFCAIVGIEPRGEYTPEQIHAAILRVGVAAVAHYESELRALASAVGYDIDAAALAA